MTKRRAKNTNYGFLSPQPKRSLRSTLKKGSIEDVSPAGDISNQSTPKQLVSKDNQVLLAPAVLPLNDSRPHLQECTNTTPQQEKVSEQIISTQEKGDPVEEDNATFSQESHTNKSSSPDVHGGEEDVTTQKVLNSLSTSDQGLNKDMDGSNQSVCEDQVYGERTSEPKMERGERSSQKDSSSEDGAASENAVMLPVRGDEAVVGAPVRKKRRRMGMCGLGERERSRSQGERHDQANRLGTGMEKAPIETEDTGQSGDDSAADLVDERGSAPLLSASALAIPCVPRVIKKCEGEVQLSRDCEIRRITEEQLQDSTTTKKQSRDGPNVEGLKVKPSMVVPGCSGDKTCQTDPTTEVLPGQRTEPLTGLQMVTQNQQEQEMQIIKLEKTKEKLHEEERGDEFKEEQHPSKTTHILEPDSSKEHQEVQNSSPKSEGDAVRREAKADTGTETEVLGIEAWLEAAAEAGSNVAVLRHTKEAGTETEVLGIEARLEAAAEAGPNMAVLHHTKEAGTETRALLEPQRATDPRAEEENVEEQSEAAATPRGSEEIDSTFSKEDSGSCPCQTVEVTERRHDTKDVSDPYGPGSLDYVSDSQLNNIDLIEEEEREQDAISCLEDVTELVCGLIRELSSLNRTIMAAHRGMENVRRGSKVLRATASQGFIPSPHISEI